MRNVWKHKRRNYNLILGLKGLSEYEESGSDHKNANFFFFFFCGACAKQADFIVPLSRKPAWAHRFRHKVPTRPKYHLRLAGNFGLFKIHCDRS